MSFCGNEVFVTTLATLDTKWDDFWDSIKHDVPQTCGLSFGSCFTCCGSVGIVGVDIESKPTLSDPEVKSVFTKCGTTDQAILTVPIEGVLVFTTALRASGPGYTWPTPSIGDDGVLYDINVNVTGSIIVSIPVYGQNYQFSKPSVDVMFHCKWSGSFPDETNILFNSVPVNDLLIKYAQLLNEKVRRKLANEISREIQENDKTFACIFEEPVLAPCNTETRTALESCHPCDTCCKCLMQQRCDGECTKCECARCTPAVWYITMFCLTVLCLIFSAVIIASIIKDLRELRQ